MFTGVTRPFIKVCTDGRIRLFWGVSPDFMSLALGIRFTTRLFLGELLSNPSTIHQEKDEEITFGITIIYIYIV